MVGWRSEAIVTPEANALAAPAVGAIMVVYVQKWLKTHDWYQRFVEWAPGANRNAHRIVAGLFALITAIGIHITVDGNADTGWNFSGHIPAVSVMLQSAWEFIKVFAIQQYVYDSSRKPEEMINGGH